MFLSSHAPMRQLAADVLVVAAMLCTLTSAYAQAGEADDTTAKAPVGRLNFEAANLPEANVEVDLSQDMFRDIFGIGDAALAGIVEALQKSSNQGEAAKATELAAQQADALRQIVQLAGDAVQEVHVRVYENAADAVEIYKPFEEQLRAGKWESLARVRKDDEQVRVAAIRDSGAVRGVFVMATDGGELVLANLVCDVSPDNVQKLTSAATRIGLENGLAEQIQLKLGPKIVVTGAEREAIAAPAPPPAPPKPAQR
jgi:hypothetical protein